MVQITVSRRHLVFLLIAAVVLVVAIPLAVSAATQRFVDVPPTDWAYDDVEWLAANGYTEGCTTDGTEYCPDKPVTRREMAAFMHRLSGDDSSTLDGRLDALETLLKSVTRNGEILLFDGMNLQVVNGQGSTATTNSLGNVIIGYNENSGDTRTGSHNLVIGPYHSWSSYGGIVAGNNSTISGKYSSVTGGYGNEASGTYSSVTGGYKNKASGGDSSVTGGSWNDASFSSSSVSGGYSNSADATYSSVSGGYTNTASGDYSSILGGNTRTVSGTDGTYPFCGC